MESVIRELWRQLPDLKAEIITLAKEQGKGLRELARVLGVAHPYIIRLSKQSDPQTAAQILTQAAIDGKITPAQLAALLGISERKAREAIQRNQPKNPKKGGRPTALTEQIKQELARLEADPATQHLSNRGKYQILCQRLGAENLPSYHTIHRYLESLPQAFTRKKRERYLHSAHPDSALPGEVWLIDRFRADVFVVDPITGEYARPECIAIIDKATRAILALGAAYRPDETTTRKRFHFDAHLAGAAILQALRGELTGVPHIPQKLILDYGKVEGAERIAQFLEYHNVLLVKARPYTPHDKAEIEGGVIKPIHVNLEAKLPGYCGSDNRPQNQPSCWSGKPKKKLVKGVLIYTDDADRPLLTIDEYNDELRAYAVQWNNQPDTDIRYRWIPRIERLRNATTPNPHIQLQYPETYLLPGATRTVYEDGTIQIYGRRYYHPALVALRAIYGTEAKVYARYSLTNRDIVYLYRIDPNNPDAIPTEWLWHYDNPQTPSSHPWYRSQATWYNREEHREGDPYHYAWINLTRAVNQAARAAIKDVRQNPIADHRMLFQYVAALIWRTAEKHLPNLLQSQPCHTPSPFTERGLGGEVPQGVEAGAPANRSVGVPADELAKGGYTTGQRTDARPALINAHTQPTTQTPLSHAVGEGQGVRATQTPLSRAAGEGQGVRANPIRREREFESALRAYLQSVVVDLSKQIAPLMSTIRSASSDEERAGAVVALQSVQLPEGAQDYYESLVYDYLYRFAVEARAALRRDYNAAIAPEELPAPLNAYLRGKARVLAEEHTARLRSQILYSALGEALKSVSALAPEELVRNLASQRLNTDLAQLQQETETILQRINNEINR